ncbi:MAG TPA: mannose-6-phosphate isomerase, class I [Spirochaetia bacterium]|nr:mannose-6-phosphate isomerase, class I [Spirochaetia bacterium]
MAIYLLTNSVQNYAWGSSTAIPALLGEAPEDGTPVAELWMGSHPKAPSHLSRNGKSVSLLTFIRDDPEGALGERVFAEFGAELPYLFKVLAADRALSIQSHPTREQAVEGFAREESAGIPIDSPVRNYRDANHKPELICALTEFWGMRGFRPAADIAADLQAVDGDTARMLVRLLGRRSESDALRGFLETLLGLPAAEVATLVAAAVTYAERQWSSYRSQGVPEPFSSSSGNPARLVREDYSKLPQRFFWLLQIARDYPDDVGVLGPLYLNTVQLNPGDATYLSAGVLHAYLRGTGIELMANSDNVLRGGCTAKHIDVPELLRTARFVSEPPRILRPEGSLPQWYRSGAREFMLSVVEVGTAEAALQLSGEGPKIVLATSGYLTLMEESASDRGTGAPLTLRKGQSAFVPDEAGTVTVSGVGRGYVAAVMETPS